MIVQDGLRRMYAEQEDVYYYITTLNENYEHPAMPEGAEEGIKKGMYLLKAGPPAGGKGKAAPRVQLLGCGSILREVMAAADLLRDDWGVEADIWSAPSFTELGRDAADVERWNLLHPTETPRRSWVEQCLGRPGRAGGGRHRLYARVRRADPALSSPRATACWARTGSAARTIARSCATSSRSTGTG